MPSELGLWIILASDTFHKLKIHIKIFAFSWQSQAGDQPFSMPDQPFSTQTQMSLLNNLGLYYFYISLYIFSHCFAELVVFIFTSLCQLHRYH